MAAFGAYSDDELRPRFEKLRGDEAPRWDEWKQQVAEARETGVAVDAGHYISGVTVIAAPVWKGGREDGGKPSHALVAIGIGAAMRGEALPRLKDVLQNAARMLSDQMRSEEHTSELQSLMRISYAVFFLQK